MMVPTIKIMMVGIFLPQITIFLSNSTVYMALFEIMQKILAAFARLKAEEV